MYAITPKGIGNPVGVRPVQDNWPLAEGETFKITSDLTSQEIVDTMVLDDDEVSLRPKTVGENLQVYKNSKIQENQSTAAELIAALFNETDPSKLLIKQLNTMARTLDLAERKADGQTLTAAEQTELDDVRTLNNQKDAIRQAENNAASLINAANSEADVDAVAAPEWPTL